MVKCSCGLMTDDFASHQEKSLLNGDYSHHPIPEARPPKSRRKRHIDLELDDNLYQFLLQDSEQNERTLCQSTRFWLKKATGIN